MKRSFVVGLASLVVFTGAMFGSVGIASAEMISYNFPLSPNSDTLTFQKFDTLGGTRWLTAVELILDANVSAHVTVENLSTLPAPLFALSLTANSSAASSIGGLTANVILNDTYPIALAPADTFPGMGPDFHDFGTLISNDNDNDLIISGLGAFEVDGAGTFTVDVDASAGFSFSGTTDAEMTITQLTGFGDVTVNYTFVPEPASLSLLAFGGFAVLRRRR